MSLLSLVWHRLVVAVGCRQSELSLPGSRLLDILPRYQALSRGMNYVAEVWLAHVALLAEPGQARQCGCSLRLHAARLSNR